MIQDKRLKYNCINLMRPSRPIAWGLPVLALILAVVG
jgi:hypothetical protein